MRLRVSDHGRASREVGPRDHQVHPKLKAAALRSSPERPSCESGGPPGALRARPVPFRVFQLTALVLHRLWSFSVGCTPGHRKRAEKLLFSDGRLTLDRCRTCILRSARRRRGAESGASSSGHALKTRTKQPRGFRSSGSALPDRRHSGTKHGKGPKLRG